MLENKEVFIPKYMKRFKCIGPKCEDTCCVGWSIPIDRETYMKYYDLMEKENNIFKEIVVYKDEKGDAWISTFGAEQVRKKYLEIKNLPVTAPSKNPHQILKKAINERDIQVVGEAVNGKEALEKAIELMPDVVLMDIVMPVMNGLEATKEICQACPRCRTLVLTQYDDEENIEASRQAGALGFIPKAAASSRLLAGIRFVSRGEHFIHTITR